MKEDKQKLRDFAVQFGAVVKRTRKLAHLTQEELAHKINSTRAAIIRIEAGQATYMPASRALEICEALDTSLNDIWKDLNVDRSGVSNGNQ